MFEVSAEPDAPEVAPDPKGALRPPQDGRKVDYSASGPARLLMERCVTDARNNQARLDRDRADWLNLLFYRGGAANQWVVYDKSSNTYIERGDDPAKGGLPPWVPRAVSNKYAVNIDGITAILNQSEPARTWYPATDDDEDRAAAEVAEDADPVLLAEIGYDDLRPEINKLITNTHAAALVVYFDNDKRHGTEEIPLLRCPVCGLETTPMEMEDAGNLCPDEQCVLPPDVQQVDQAPQLDPVTGEPSFAPEPTEPLASERTPGDLFEPVIDPMGVPMGVPYAKGKLCATVVPSFELSMPSSARVCDADRLPWVLTHSEMPTEEILGRWPSAKASLDRNSGRKAGGIQRGYARQMRQLSSPSRAQSAYGAAGSGDGTIVYILHHDPIDDGEHYFPDGLLAVRIEDVIVECGPLPVQDDQGKARKSVILRTFASSPGSPYGKPPGDDLVPLQVQRNMIQSLILLILMHDASPTTYVPLSVTLENQPTGMPGETVYYRSMDGSVPTRQAGANPPEGLFRQLEINDQEFNEISKLNSVLAGARPEGDPTLGEVQILQERGMASFKEALDSQVRFETKLSRTLMWLARSTGWADRFRQVRGENGQWEISQFNAADIAGKVDLQIDKQTAWPKSPLMRMLRIQKAVELGVIPPPMTDPELQAKLLSEMDLADLKPSADADRKQIARELDRWKAAKLPQEIVPPDPTNQELPIHLHFKKQFLKTEEFEALRGANAPLAMAMLGHVQTIQLLLMQAAAAQAAAANPKPPEKDERTPVEKGDTSALDSALSEGALQPAGAAPQADPLGDAITAGALQPAGAVPQPVGPSIDELAAGGVLTPAPQVPPAPLG